MRSSPPSARALLSAFLVAGTAAVAVGLTPAVASPEQTVDAPSSWDASADWTLPAGPAATSDAPGAAAEVVAKAPHLVVLRDGVGPAEVDALVAEVRGLGGTVAARLDRTSPGFTGSLTPRAEAFLRDHASVVMIEDNAVFTATGRQGGAPWHLDRIDQLNRPLDGDYAYGSATRHSTGKGVRIYVLDSGVRATHREVRGRVGKGFSAIRGVSARKDPSGHGTHVAALAAGRTAGVAKKATIVPVRVFGRRSTTSTRNVLRGINWVSRNRQKPAVLNLSLAGPPNRAVARAIKRAQRRGVHMVAAAGNEGADACRVAPARMPQVLAVGALDKRDRPTPFSNRGPCVELWAPGQAILSAGIRTDRAMRRMSGTSMSAPMVAGTLARMLQVQRTLKPAAARRAVVAGAPQQDVDGYLAHFLFAGVRDDVHRTGVPSPSLTTNPGFEQGIAGWDRLESTLVTDDPAIPAARGSWKAVLGGTGTAQVTGIRQAFTVPQDVQRAWASFRLRVLTQERTQGSPDQMRIAVYDASGNTVIGVLGYFSNRHASSRFARFEVNLQQYRGRTIHLAFEAVEDASRPTTFVLDDVYAAAR